MIYSTPSGLVKPDTIPEAVVQFATLKGFTGIKASHRAQRPKLTPPLPPLGPHHPFLALGPLLRKTFCDEAAEDVSKYLEKSLTFAVQPLLTTHRPFAVQLSQLMNFNAKTPSRYPHKEVQHLGSLGLAMAWNH